MDERVDLRLSRDEAIVLFEWLGRLDLEPGNRFQDQAEQRVLWNLQASLESVLTEPFSPDYQRILASARSRVRDSDR